MSWVADKLDQLRSRRSTVSDEPGPPVTLTVQAADGQVHTGSVSSNTLLLRASRKVGVPLENMCANRGLCLTCAVRVPPDSVDALTPADSVERRYLDWIGAPADVRLSCQVKIMGDAAIRAHLVPTSRWDYDTHDHWWNDLQYDDRPPEADNGASSTP